MVDAERDADHARGDYYHAIRRLHLAGGSMREIAAVLDLSHQRVHQIVESVGGAGRRWRPPSTDPKNLRCSFCGVDQKKARKLVAGPGVYICNECVAAATIAVMGGREARSKGTTFVAVDESSARNCSFCGKDAAARVGPMAFARDDVICGECLELCRDIIEERQAQAK